jgi:glucose-6-phosphate-specific signal transduction histidine kinase
MFKAFVAIISFLAACFNFTLLDITIFSIAPVLSGFPTNVLMGMYIKKYPHYKLFGSILSLSTVLIMAAAYPMFNTSKLWVTLINTVLLGVVLMPMISLMVEFAMEVSYPCGESISVGILFSGGQIFGVIIGEIGSIILDH